MKILKYFICPPHPTFLEFVGSITMGTLAFVATGWLLIFGYYAAHGQGTDFLKLFWHLLA